MPTSTPPLTVAALIRLLQDAPPADVVLMLHTGETVPCFPSFDDEQGVVVITPLA